MLPVHNGTFDLGMHRWQEPLDRILALANAKGVAITTPQMGEQMDMRRPAPTLAWWSDVDKQAGAK